MVSSGVAKNAPASKTAPEAGGAKRVKSFRCCPVTENGVAVWEVQEAEEGGDYHRVAGTRSYENQGACEAVMRQLDEQENGNA